MKSTLFPCGALQCVVVIVLYSILTVVLGHPSPRSPSSSPSPSPSLSGRQAMKNPIADGWYADPDGVRFGDTYWIYATLSIQWGKQDSFDAFSSKDLVTWKHHPSVFSTNGSKWAEEYFWAPCTVERDGRYYFFYSANKHDEPTTTHEGIGVAVANTPGGPFVDLVDHPIVRSTSHINGPNAMDQMVFIDDDGTYYLIWGGGKAVIAPLNKNMTTLDLWPDKLATKDITPTGGYNEGPFMLKRKGKYYLMWSEGGYGDPNYSVAYGMSDKLTGPFERIGLILSEDGVIADGPGHHSVFKGTWHGEEHYYIAYHRRIIGDSVADHRVLAVDRLDFQDDGLIKPVVMT